MRKIILLMITMVLMLGFSTGLSFATDTTVSAVAASVEVPSGFSITSPMETSAIAFWFPATGIYAGGISHTFLRLNHSAITFMSLDFDGTVAQEINHNNKTVADDGTVKETQDNDTLAGIGIKANFNTTKNTEKGFKFLPSIGLTALNNFSKFKTLEDIVQNYDIAFYGTLLSYRW